MDYAGGVADEKPARSAAYRVQRTVIGCCSNRRDLFVRKEPAFNRYAKIGWVEQPGGNRHTFFEWNTDNSGSFWYQNLYAPEPPGSWHYYGVLVNNKGPGILSFQVDGNTLKSGDVYAPVPGTGYDTAEMWSQTTRASNQIAGSVRNNEVFAGSHVWQQDTCRCNQLASGWYDFGYGAFQPQYYPVNSGPSWYDAEDYGGSTTSFETFDRGCPK